ncbi:hypothetical protein ACNI5A_32590, partial [Klebsiella pneumoniae]|uniref:hypothetical protein n=1 Tax=Klebsiella pneumoniae TaxID=573 RepID=UPI003A878713
LPDLFNRDPIDWTCGPDRSAQLRRLYEMKQDPLFTDSAYSVEAFPGDILRAVHRAGDRRMTGVFSLKGSCGLVPVDAP